MKKRQVEVCACTSLAQMEVPTKIRELTVSRQIVMTGLLQPGHRPSRGDNAADSNKRSLL